jgi:glucokinase
VILAGDIGGTNTRLALFAPRGESFEVAWKRTYPSRASAGLVEIVRAARREFDLPVDAASFGVAGPVQNGVSRATNLAWVVDAAELARELKLQAVGLINDLEANAYGLLALAGDDLCTLHEGARGARGNLGLISPGTGLGEAGLYFDGRRHWPFACEGGHCGFNPSDELDVELWRFLQTRVGRHVSWERVLSGPGLVSIYEFLRDVQKMSAPGWLAEEIARDKAAAISRAALEHKAEICEQAMTLFVRNLGVEAGNLALKCMATGGLYIGGGIAPRILPLLEEPTFLSAFLDAFLSKGRLRPLLESMPVRVIKNDQTALLGAARHAALETGLLVTPEA